MVEFADQSRYEFKYQITPEMIPQIGDYIKPYTTIDPHLKDAADNKYTVRSIYFDTPTLDFYYEKMDGLKIRKKLRIRTYNEMNDFAFLEIKRKFINCIAKERSKLPIMVIEKLINAPENSVIEYPESDYNSRLVSGKFVYTLLKKGLLPVLLVVYEREAYVGLNDDRERLTLDTDVRGIFEPDLGDILITDNFIPIKKNVSILELKFDDVMPQWMKNLVLELDIKRESISKYCLGIDACRENEIAEESR
jgi:SPX domain protein involved in polyphosphate accumulation